MIHPTLIDAPPGGVPVRLLKPKDNAGLHIIMLHGWGGDENVMWQLQSVLPENAYLVAPRGIYSVSSGGFQWSSSPTSIDDGVGDFAPAIEALSNSLEALRHSHGFGNGSILMMGFSQGVAVATAAALAGIVTTGIIALAGFIPTGDLQALNGLPIFWGHGVQDELVPVERARSDVRRLLDVGAHVHYCEAEVGHKLGLECTKGLKRWLADQQPQRKQQGVGSV